MIPNTEAKVVSRHTRSGMLRVEQLPPPATGFAVSVSERDPMRHMRSRTSTTVWCGDTEQVKAVFDHVFGAGHAVTTGDKCWECPLCRLIYEGSPLCDPREGDPRWKAVGIEEQTSKLPLRKGKKS